MKLIPHNKPTVGKEEMKAVNKILQRKWLIAGKEVEKLEHTFTQLTGKKFAVAVQSGHAALHISLLVMGIHKHAKVILPSFSVPDILNTLNYTDAAPVLIDNEENSFNFDPSELPKRIDKNTKAIIIPHMFGFPAKVDQITDYGIPVIEDCAQALGTTHKGLSVGSFGEIAIFSFYASKIITSGQGGMIVTDNPAYYSNMKDLIRYNGRRHYRIRYNYQMTDITASIANAQYKKLSAFIRRRRFIAEKYQEILRKKNRKHRPGLSENHTNYFRFLIECENSQHRNTLIRAFARKGIITGTPLSEHEILHTILHRDKHDYPNAHKMAENILSIPLYPKLRAEEIKRIISLIDKLL
jgi:perosamine synthetase